jgi:hypothetical protein
MPIIVPDLYDVRQGGRGIKTLGRTKGKDSRPRVQQEAGTQS